MKSVIKMIVASGVAVVMSGCVIVADVDSNEDGFRIRKNYGDTDDKSNLVDMTVSNKSFEATLADLRAAIDTRGMKTFAVVDHAAGAVSVGKTLPPTTLVIFGHPQGGTPLIMSNRLMGIDLPLKAMVWEKDGEVMISITDIKALAEFRDIDDQDELLDKVSGALDAILSEATH